MSELICALSTHSKKLNIYLSDGIKDFSFSKEILNMEDIIFEEIEKGLKEMDKNFSDISVICIVRGPGRFTGIRISYTFASVFKAISRCKVYGVDVFDIFAYKFFLKYSDENRVCVVLRAFKNEHYYLRYHRVGNRPVRIGKPLWVFEKELLRFIDKWNDMIISDEEDGNVYHILPTKKLADRSISRILPKDIADVALYFKNTDITPLYLKPAKFEL